MATSKSNKKIETPIDNRETFTSLSTSMKDTDADNMKEKLHTLYKIQQADSKIDSIHLLRGELPEEVRDLEDEIEGKKTRIANITVEISDIEHETNLAKQELTIAGDAKIKYEDQRSNVKNSREYNAISKEIENEDLNFQLAEKKVSELKTVILEKNAKLKETKEFLVGREEDLVIKKTELVSITDETAKEEENLLAKIEDLKNKIDERMYFAYKKVRSNARNGLAVVTIYKGACGGCFNKIPPQRQIDIMSNKKIIVCEYCGRILVSNDFDGKIKPVEEEPVSKKRITRKKIKKV
ncbi:MAG: C4-type zinc ribbon domain-containing protein [Bacteroidales bacterium]